MKSLLVLIALLSVSIVEAQETKVETRSVYTGQDQVISVGTCSYASEDTIFNQLKSEFTMTRCREVKTFQVNVESSGKWYKWGKKVSAIPGTESYSYEMTTDTEATTRTYSSEEGYSYWEIYEVRNQCNQVRNAYASQTMDVSKTTCVTGASENAAVQ